MIKMINEAKEELENTLRHNDEKRREERVSMDAMIKEQRVCMT